MGELPDLVAKGQSEDEGTGGARLDHAGRVPTMLAEITKRNSCRAATSHVEFVE